MTDFPEFDPYHLLVKKKKASSENNPTYTVEYNADDVAALEEFCKKHGILGFNINKMDPKSALRMLKKKMGLHYEGGLGTDKKMLLD